MPRKGRRVMLYPADHLYGRVKQCLTLYLYYRYIIRDCLLDVLRADWRRRAEWGKEHRGRREEVDCSYWPG
jgi:hypothetical protein